MLMDSKNESRVSKLIHRHTQYKAILKGRNGIPLTGLIPTHVFLFPSHKMDGLQSAYNDVICWA